MKTLYNGLFAVSALVLSSCDSEESQPSVSVQPAKVEEGPVASTNEQPIEKASPAVSDPVPVVSQPETELTKVSPSSASPKVVEVIDPIDIWTEEKIAEFNLLKTKEDKISKALEVFSSEELRQNPFVNFVVKTSVNGKTEETFPETIKGKKRLRILKYVIQEVMIDYEYKKALEALNQFESVLAEERGHKPLSWSIVDFGGRIDNHEILAEPLLTAKEVLEARIENPGMPVVRWYSFENAPIGWGGGSSEIEKSANAFVQAGTKRRLIYLDENFSSIRLEALADLSNRYEKNPAKRTFYVHPEMTLEFFEVSAVPNTDKTSYRIVLKVEPTASELKNFLSSQLELVAKHEDLKLSLQGNWKNAPLSQAWLKLPGHYYHGPRFDVDVVTDFKTGRNAEVEAIQGKRQIDQDGVERVIFEFESSTPFGANCAGQCFQDLLLVYNLKASEGSEQDYLIRDLPLTEWFSPILNNP